MSDENKDDQPKAEDVPLGKGLADNAKKKIQRRSRDIDDFVDRATKGQTTDSDN